jgi:teichuronic acid biosynthesis glycosyltransferase TuaH
MDKLSFLFLSANSPWAYGMAEALSQYHPTHAVQFYDWQFYYRHKPNWSSRTPPSLLKRSIHVLPTGYAGRLEILFRFYLQQLIQSWCQKLVKDSGSFPWIIAPEPYLTSWVRKVPLERLIYYNFDDYILYRPNRKQQILKQEKELVERAHLTLCASNSHRIALQKQHPHRAERILHFPHGVIPKYINPNPEKPPEPMTVGFVGTLGDRLDWRLIHQVVQACPEITFVFVGGLDQQIMVEQGDWQSIRAAVLALENVRHVGRVSSDQVAEYYWSFAINWIPYVVNHPFNQASCPTKIMDGVASSRPILSTDIPECRLYPDWITIFHNVEDAIALVRRQLALSEQPEAYEKNLKQLEFAHQHTWQNRAYTLESLLLSRSTELNIRSE